MKTLFSILMASFCLSTAHSKIFYVKANHTGQGDSWEDASGDLNAVLFAATYGDEIWVAKGVYYPTNDNNRLVSFIIYNGLKVYGGFEGHERSIEERNWRKHKTILSGEIGKKTSKDNSFSVVYLKNVSSQTLIDGFIISDGSANKGGESGHIQKSGGALYNNGSGPENASNPIIKNCHFTNNYARDGGAVYNNGMDGGNANPTFINCTFYNNRTDLDGGAFYNDGRRKGTSNPILQKCTFLLNKGNYGGAFFNYGGAGTAIPMIEKCRFENNEAYLNGSNSYNIDIEGNALIKFSNCDFVKNTSLSLKASR